MSTTPSSGDGLSATPVISDDAPSSPATELDTAGALRYVLSKECTTNSG